MAGPEQDSHKDISEKNTSTSVSNPSARLLQEAMPDARQIQADLKAGNTSGLMKDALTVNKMNNPEFSQAVQADLTKMGFPDVAITSQIGMNGKMSTDIVNLAGKDGTMDTYWANGTTTGDVIGKRSGGGDAHVQVTAGGGGGGGGSAPSEKPQEPVAPAPPSETTPPAWHPTGGRIMPV
ncbi:MAG TPA: hypothetical protein V6C72_00525 [Chroococcales cyanobacterium]